MCASGWPWSLVRFSRRQGSAYLDRPVLRLTGRFTLPSGKAEGEMTTKELQVLAYDPGGTTGWVLLVVSRLAIFGDEEPAILEWDYGELNGPEPQQSIQIARLAREFQGLAYKTGPAVVGEQWDIDATFNSTDQESYSPVRINAQVQLLHYEGRLNDATLHFQSRSLAFRRTDDYLRRQGLYVEGSTHIRAAAKHAITILRRAREKRAFAHELWPYPPNGKP